MWSKMQHVTTFKNDLIIKINQKYRVLKKKKTSFKNDLIIKINQKYGVVKKKKTSFFFPFLEIIFLCVLIC